MLPLLIISDNNNEDVYFSLLKYSIWRAVPDVYIFEYCVSKSADKINKAAAYILLNEHSFSENSVFYIEVNIGYLFGSNQKILLIQYNNKWILTPDNGLAGLLEKEKIQKIYDWKEPICTTFYAKNEMLNALKYLVNHSFVVGHQLREIGIEKCQRLNWWSMVERRKNNDEKILLLPILLIDSYGNIILNFRKRDYELLCEKYDVKIQLPYSTIDEINDTYNQKGTNKEVAVFNDAGYLELLINDGGLAQMIVHQDIYSGANYHISLLLKLKR